MELTKFKNTPKAFVYIWTVENFSYCTEKTGSFIRSPPFIVEELQNTKWFLLLYPRGKGNSSVISCFLSRAGQDDGPREISVSYELAFSTPTDSLLSFERVLQTSIKPNEFENSYVTIERNDISTNALRISCRMWKGNHCPFETLSRRGFSCVQVQRYWFDWLLECKNGALSIQSSESHAQTISSTPRLQASLSQSLDTKTDQLYFSITPGDIGVQEITIKLYALDAKGSLNMITEKEFTKEQLSQLQDNNFSIEIKWNDLIGLKNNNFPSNTLTLRGELVTSCGFITTYNIQHPQRNECINEEVPEFIKTQLCTSLFSFREEEILTDIVLKSENKEFPAHKLVLSSSSEVFKSMFTSDMLEKSGDSIDMSDFRDDVVHNLLLFVYTGQIEFLAWDLAIRLYYLADKYHIQQLRDKCLESLMLHLTPTNFVDGLILANLHQDINLKTFIEDYIQRNSLSVFDSDVWKTFEKESSELAMETQKNIIRKSSFCG